MIIFPPCSYISHNKASQKVLYGDFKAPHRMKILVAVEPPPPQKKKPSNLWQRLTIELKHYNDLILG